MITLNFDLGTETAKLAFPAILKPAGDVRVRVIFSAAPGEVNVIQFALGKDATPTETLAYTEDFEEENETTWSALLDAADTRLVTFMSGKGTIVVNAELTCTIDGEKKVSPNVSVTIQPLIVTGPESSESGPEYLTDETIAAIYMRKSWQLRAANYTAQAGDRVQADTSGGVFTITLPTAPNAGNAVEIEDATASFATHNLTLARNGAKINGGTADFTASTANQKLKAVYISAGYGWSIK